MMKTASSISVNPWLNSQETFDRVIRYWADPPEPLYTNLADGDCPEQQEEVNGGVKKVEISIQ